MSVFQLENGEDFCLDGQNDCAHSGFVVHHDCLKYLANKVGEPVINFGKMLEINPNIKAEIDGPQFYDWDETLENEGAEFFISPLMENSPLRPIIGRVAKNYKKPANGGSRKSRKSRRFNRRMTRKY
jgi:hypothetical protein